MDTLIRMFFGEPLAPVQNNDSHFPINGQSHSQNRADHDEPSTTLAECLANRRAVLLHDSAASNRKIDSNMSSKDDGEFSTNQSPFSRPQPRFQPSRPNFDPSNNSKLFNPTPNDFDDRFFQNTPYRGFDSGNNSTHRQDIDPRLNFDFHKDHDHRHHQDLLNNHSFESQINSILGMMFPSESLFPRIPQDSGPRFNSSSTSQSQSIRSVMRGDGITETTTTTTTRKDGVTRVVTRRQTSDGSIDETTETIS